MCLAAEQDACEFSDALAELQIAVLCQPESADDAAWRTKTYPYSCQACVSSRETLHMLQNRMSSCSCSLQQCLPHPGTIRLRSSADMLAGSTGCHDWEAGFALAQYVMSHAAAIKGQQCLELGCGTGLVSMCLHLSGASSVVATDGNAAAVDNCSHNFAQNDIPHQRGHALRMPGQVQLVQYQWAEPCPWRPDMVLGADLLYDPGGIHELVRLLTQLCNHQSGHPQSSCRAILAATIRNQDTIALFEKLVSDASLVLDDVSHLLHKQTISFLHLHDRQHSCRVRLLHITST